MTQEQLRETLIIDAVVTMPEAISMWGKTRKSIENQIYKERLTARKAGGSWLIAVPSLRRLWGEPLHTTVKDE